MLLPKTYSLLATAATLLPSKNVYQFPDNGTWLENIAVRSNGDLLVTMLSPTPSLYTLKQPYSSSPEFSLIHTFPDATGLLGITETEDDTFAIISTKLIDNAAPVLGSSAIWEVAFSGDSASTRKIAALPDLGLPNGATLAIPGAQAVLIADCLGGTVTRCDTQTGATSTVLSIDETKGDETVEDSLGINGMHYQDGYLYWSNSAQVSLFRISVDNDGNPLSSAEAELVGKIDALFVDDFALDSSNTAWLATNPSNSIVALKSDGSAQVVVGGSGSTTVAGATSAAFGRTSSDSKKLYVTTRGVSEPAKIVAVDISSFA